tara:strand:- start:6892 stop:7995 length:1104 start_codon:yes stop_codon:yes gene_type:complete
MKKFHKSTNVLVTGGAGFIGAALIRKLLEVTECNLFILDKLSYASDIEGIRKILDDKKYKKRLFFWEKDLTNFEATKDVIHKCDPDYVFHLAAESHVDRSIDKPLDFIQNNIIGTYNLLEVVRNHWFYLDKLRKDRFRFHHISTDEVFGSLDYKEKRFDEKTPYDPRSPYSATKASSDHLVRAWYHTYGLPIIITNCSNNFGPRQFPEKLIPLVIQKALNKQQIPLYGNGSNIRDWLYVDDHIEALLLAISEGKIGETYCIGGFGEHSNLEVVNFICDTIQTLKPLNNFLYRSLITPVEDRPGHDLRYAINSSKIISELGWRPKHSFQEALRITINWYIKNPKWCEAILQKSGYLGDRLGIMKNTIS